MRDAAVGFQCPDCVAEGSRTTRTARTTYGGLRPTNAGFTSFVLIGINVAVWVAILATGSNSSRLLDLLGLRPDGVCDLQNGFLNTAVGEPACTAAGATWLPGVADGAWWQLLTTAFTHVQPMHIGFNMLALYVLGPQLEAVLGRARFLALYLISALAGSALVYWAGSQYQLTVGASGAIYGLMGALLVISLKLRINPQQILLWIGLNFLLTVVANSTLSWQGHLGGFLGGVACAGILAYAPRARRTPLQVAGLTAVTVALLVAVVLRTAALA